MFLNEIVKQKKVEVRATRGWNYQNELKSKIARQEEKRNIHSFQAALSQKEKFPTGSKIHLIAEVKKASPSKGVIREDFDPEDIAVIYEKSGATAISVLTEKTFFQGDISYLEKIRSVVSLPLLRKDFMIDESQIPEAKAYGADAILLIAAILDKNQIHDYHLLAGEYGLDTLVEVHNEKELEKVIEWAPVIGINNRDLATFEVDLATTFRLLKRIPCDRIVVAESGISRRDDLMALLEAQVRAVLIGEAFMKEKDIGAAVSSLFPPLERDG